MRLLGNLFDYLRSTSVLSHETIFVRLRSFAQLSCMLKIETIADVLRFIGSFF